MKTMVSKLSLVTLLLFFVSTSVSYSKKDPRKTNNGNNPAGITYIVEIDASATVSQCITYIVSVRDEYGNNVDAPVMYTEGVSTYVFHEAGPVSGTRSAHLERVKNNHICSNTLYTQPHHIQSSFRNGMNYLFFLHPSSVPNNN